VHEPYLIQEGYLQRTPQGRVLTAKAWQTIGLKPLADGESQNSLTGDDRGMDLLFSDSMFGDELTEATKAPQPTTAGG
jgi:hypothetical protein